MTPIRFRFAGLVLALGLAAPAAGDWGPIEVAGRTVAPGQSLRYPWGGETSFEATYLDAPVFVTRGTEPGPTLCVTAGIHGDELNGTEIARRAFSWVQADELAGTLLVFPMVNAAGVRSGNRYMQDRRDLNREFPGRSRGSVTAIVAHRLFSEITRHCSHLVDLHTGSFARRNHPQVRVTANDDEALALARHFGVDVVVLSEGPRGSLRREASEAGIHAFIYEAGEPLRFDVRQIAAGVRGIESVMDYLGMTGGGREMETPASRVYAETTWVRVPPGQGGFFFPTAELGERVSAGDPLGSIIDPYTDRIVAIEATADGEIIGLATAQIVLSGYALVHLGVGHR